MTFRVIDKPSPNYSIRPENKVIAVVIHIAQAPHMQSIDNTFLSKDSKSSSHYAVPRIASPIHQYVSENFAAWHTGLPPESYTDPAQRPIWPLFTKGMNPNNVTIGIENVGFSVSVTYAAPKGASDALDGFAVSLNVPLGARVM